MPLAVEALAVGPIHLRVRAIDAALDFYGELLGLESGKTADRAWAGGGVALWPPAPDRARDTRSTEGAEPPPASPLLILHPEPSAPPRSPGAPGLFHTAFLVPDRSALARLLRRLAQRQVRLDGASDHRVSEALYLSDPEGNGVELYVDRPDSDWRTAPGKVQMATLPLDLNELLAWGGEDAAPLPPGTRVGHLHLRGASLEAGERFFHRALGMEITTDRYPGALFFSRGGYHHHLALNTWGTAPDSTRDPSAAGLIGYELEHPSAAPRRGVIEGLQREGFPHRETETGAVETEDPVGIPVRLHFGPRGPKLSSPFPER